MNKVLCEHSHPHSFVSGLWLCWQSWASVRYHITYKSTTFTLGLVTEMFTGTLYRHSQNLRCTAGTRWYLLLLFHCVFVRFIHMTVALRSGWWMILHFVFAIQSIYPFKYRWMFGLLPVWALMNNVADNILFMSPGRPYPLQSWQGNPLH